MEIYWQLLAQLSFLLVQASLCYKAYDTFIRGCDGSVNCLPFFALLSTGFSALFLSFNTERNYDDITINLIACITAGYCIGLAYTYSLYIISAANMFLFILTMLAIIVTTCLRNVFYLKILSYLTSLALIASPLADIYIVTDDQSYLQTHLLAELALYAFIHAIESYIACDYFSLLFYIVGVLCIFLQAYLLVKCRTVPEAVVSR
jgi:hypothetical protein